VKWTGDGVSLKQFLRCRDTCKVKEGQIARAGQNDAPMHMFVSGHIMVIGR
jgi:uncharacterized protein (DUF983 family)